MLTRLRALQAAPAPRALREEIGVWALGAAFGLAPIAIGALWLGSRSDVSTSLAGLAQASFFMLAPIAVGLLLTAASLSPPGGKAAPADATSLKTLADALMCIGRDKDFSVRLPVYSGAPTSAVAAAINVLLASIETRERELQAELGAVSMMRDQAEATSRAKSSFLANMSHELRTPLNAIMGYANMLQEDAQLAGHITATNDLDRILRAARHLLSLINDVLDLSKIEAGRIQLEYRPSFVRDIVEEALTSVGASTGKNKNVFFLNNACADLSMITDTIKVKQCLINLLSNAFKFTKDGRVTLDVSLRRAPGGDEIVFCIVDTGIGISEAQLGTLFESFTQADPSITRMYGGTGLGLTITRKLASLLGGEVTVASCEGQGSTFTLSVPREPVAAAPLPTIACEPQSIAPAEGKQVALVIDDDATAIDLMSRWLGRLGYAIVSAPDGEKGLALARAHRPHLILLDLHMPQRTGWEILDLLKTDTATANIPVIIVSVDDDRKRGIVAGASEFITKPASPEQLARVADVYRATATGTILVVDDDQDAGDLIERAVRQAGFDVLRAFDGDDGLAQARAHAPAAIVLDLSMPGKDGFAVVAALGADPVMQGIPVIVVSARALSDSEFQNLARAGCAFHPKGVASPFEIASNVVTAVKG
jgi:signal transduction histidine kinase/DNA-binding response OmpR family regulator